MKSIILEHWRRHPDMEVQDAVKLLYQSEFGGGHMIKDEAASLERLKEEAHGRKQGTGPLWEPVGCGLGRLHLDILSCGLRPETMNRMFVLTANAVHGTTEGFEQKLKLLLECAEQGLIGFTAKEAESYCRAYQAQGYPAVSHSAFYHESYDPSYRLVGEAFWKSIEVFKAVDVLLANQTGTITAAIDGKSGSGKSTLGALMEAVYGCGLIHMDDFFLQPFQRTKARFDEAGGNVDYERFDKEVLAHLCQEEAFTYQTYNCRIQQLAASRTVAPGRLRVVEGVYSQHPHFYDAYDLKIYLDIDREAQTERIRSRNGEAMLKRFQEEWIPLENRYFDTYDIPGRSNLCLQNL